MPAKLTLYTNSDRVVILRYEKIEGKQCWQMIDWDLTTGQIVEGQWLMNKQLFVKGCALSPCGRYFYWIYNQFQSRTEMAVAGVSPTPYFSAYYHGSAEIGRTRTAAFASSMAPIDVGVGLQRTDICPANIEMTPITEAALGKSEAALGKSEAALGKSEAALGKSEAAGFLCDSNTAGPIAVNQGIIRLDGYCVYLNDSLVYDGTGAKFRPVGPPFDDLLGKRKR